MKKFACIPVLIAILILSVSMFGCADTGVSVVTGKGVDRENTSTIGSESESDPSTEESADTSDDGSDTAKSDKPSVQSSTPSTTKVPSETKAPSTTAAPDTTKAPSSSEKEITVTVNTSTKVYHVNPNCTHVKRMKAENRSQMTATPSSLAALGYKPCGTCSKSYK